MSVGLPRNFYRKRTQVNETIETIYLQPIVTGTSVTKPFTINEMVNRGFRIQSFTISIDQDGIGAGTTTCTVNGEALETYVTDAAAHTFKWFYQVKNTSSAHAITIAAPETMSNFTIQARLKYDV